MRPVLRIKSWLAAVTMLALLLNSLAAFAARPETEKDKYLYRPIARARWAQAERLIGDKKPAQVFAIVVPPSASNVEKDEWKLMVAKALVANDKPLHALYLLGQLAIQGIGTNQGTEALRLMHEIAKAGPVDEAYLEELAFDYDSRVDEPQSRSMLAYFKARALMRKGYKKWAEQALADIDSASSWSQEFSYDRALQTLNSGDTADSYVEFEQLTKNPEARVPTARMSQLALARLIFERKDYRAAIATYLTIDLPTRERARSLSELAWSYYYDRAYGKALGVLRALKSPYFRDVLSPETYLLELLIYHELCHFKTVKDLVISFNTNYKRLFSAIEDRKPLDNIPEFVQMGLQEGVLQHRALAIQKVRSERFELLKQKWSNETQRRALTEFGLKRERTNDAEITRMLKVRSDRLANWFLDLREQVNFLDYESSMRMIQGSEGGLNQYQPPQASRSRPDTIFWPVGDEAWLDELLNYEVLVSDSCASPTAGGTK